MESFHRARVTHAIPDEHGVDVGPVLFQLPQVRLRQQQHVGSFWPKCAHAESVALRTHEPGCAADREGRPILRGGPYDAAFHLGASTHRLDLDPTTDQHPDAVDGVIKGAQQLAVKEMERSAGVPDELPLLFRQHVCALGVWLALMWRDDRLSENLLLIGFQGIVQGLEELSRLQGAVGSGFAPVLDDTLTEELGLNLVGRARDCDAPHAGGTRAAQNGRQSPRARIIHLRDPRHVQYDMRHVGPHANQLLDVVFQRRGHSEKNGATETHHFKLPADRARECRPAESHHVLDGPDVRAYKAAVGTPALVHRVHGGGLLHHQHNLYDDAHDHRARKAARQPYDHDRQHGAIGRDVHSTPRVNKVRLAEAHAEV
mmetsp:Transcript_31360/g.86214  ORF Transcript_31360/g.86214 Transcript_31360/m.86214 type:complete len:372 (+) Transcript_31360:238-1353(+)